MRDLMDADGPCPAASETAVHGLFRAIDGLEVLTPAVAPAGPAPASPEASVAAPSPEGAAVDEAAIAAAVEARRLGAECFKAKDFAGAEARYGEAIAATPPGHTDLPALHSNRSAARLQLGDAAGALADAVLCVGLAPQWPKGHFRHGCCLRQIGDFPAAIRAFRAGQALEAENKDWEKEADKTELLRSSQPASRVRQLVLSLLPELVLAWSRGKDADASGVLQLQVKGELKDMGTPKWRLLRDGQNAAKAQVRYAFVRRKDHLANLAACLQQSPPVEGVAVADCEGKPLKIAEIMSFLSAGDSAEGVSACMHIDVNNNGKMAALLCRLPCGLDLRRFAAASKDPPPPKGAVDGVLQLQKQSGFPKALPRYLGFQSIPGDLNFPVIDLERDAPDAS